MEVFANAGLMALASMFVGVLPLTMGIVYAIWPNEQRLMLTRTLSLATVFAAVAGVALGFINELRFISRSQAVLTSPQVMIGVAEGAGPAVLRVRMSDRRLAVRDPRALATSMSLQTLECQPAAAGSTAAPQIHAPALETRDENDEDAEDTKSDGDEHGVYRAHYGWHRRWFCQDRVRGIARCGRGLAN